MLQYIVLFLVSVPVWCVEKEIVVIIPSYNNAQWYTRNLTSLLSQEYHNYRAIYIDDCSSDDTGALVEEFLHTYDHNKRVTLVRNQGRYGALANHWRAVQVVNDEAIVVHLDGDDWFAHRHVLQRINQAYTDENVWMTYGQFVTYPQQTVGHSMPPAPHVVDTNTWRDTLLRYSHVRTFYAWLFKRIKLDDLLVKNIFFPVACDNAFMFPMLEMAGAHVQCIPEILYVYNQDTPLNDFKKNLKTQLLISRYITQKKRYEPLSEVTKNVQNTKSVDIILFSFNRPLQLYACLESIERYMKGIKTISVLYRASDESFRAAYQKVRDSFRYVRWIEQSEQHAHYTFKQETLSLVRDATTYVMFGVDDNIVKEDVNLQECTTWLEKTHAYGFFLRLGTNITKAYLQDLSTNTDSHVAAYQEIWPGIFAWQFKFAKHDWAYPNTLDMTIYRKAEIVPTLEQLRYTTPNTLEANWYGATDFSNIGLCYRTSKIVNIPLNIVQEAAHNHILNRHVIEYDTNLLLDYFNAGKIFDIFPLYKINNESAHIDYTPTFRSLGT
jgi:glycosyltransferase involved in cell wall biosynthesis